MNFRTCCVALVAALALSGAAMAEEVVSTPAAVKAGVFLKSSDGKRVGRIERIVTAKDGTPLSAGVIFDSRFVYVPLSTISSSDAGVVTSLSRAEVSKLK